MRRIVLLTVLCGASCQGPTQAEPGLFGVDLPASAGALDPLMATVRGASGSVRYSWLVDGRDAGIEDAVVGSEHLELGQVWEVTVSDRDQQARAVASIDRLGGNILVVLVDDLGVDKVGAYGVHEGAPPTPNIDALAAEGVLFRNVWAQPTCSPTRASLFTGRHARRTGVGRWIMPPSQRGGMDPDETVVPEMLALAPLRHDDALVGKWHLSGFLENDDAAIDPMLVGFSWHAGTLGNPDNAVNSAPGSKGYSLWERAENGLLTFETDYLTTVTTDDALGRLDVMREPWFLAVAYNAPHTPLHIPPRHLQGSGLGPGDEATDEVKYDAMVEALDNEVGRLLDGITPDVRARTTVVFLSDNGTPERSILAPLDPSRAKGTVYEGGVKVPMIVSGPAVTAPGSETLALVESVDLFPTVAEIAGVDLEQVLDPRTGEPVVLDGVSFLGHVTDPGAASTRSLAYTSKHFPNGKPPYDWEQDAIRDHRFKLAYHSEHGYWFFEYVDPFDEGPELLESGSLTPEQQDAMDRLDAALSERMGGMQFGP